MPLTTINPLMSALGTLGPALWAPPVPDGPGVDQADRQQVAGVYAGLLAADAGGSTTIAGTFDGGGAILLAVGAAGAVDGTFAGGGTLSGDATASATIAGTFLGGGTLSGDATASASLAGTFDAGGSLSGDVTPSGLFSGTFDGGGLLSGDATASTTAAGTFDAGGTLALALGAAGAADGTFLAGGTLSGDVAARAAISGTLAGGGTLSGDAAVRYVLAGAFAGGGTLAGDATATAAIAGTFVAGATLRGNLAGVGSETFLVALRTRLRSLPGLADLSDVYLTTSPAGAAFPFLVLNRLWQSPTINTNDSYYKETAVQFTVISDDPERAADLGDAAYDLLLPNSGTAPIYFTDGYEMTRLPGMSHGPTADATGQERGDLVWRFSFDSTFLIGKG